MAQVLDARSTGNESCHGQQCCPLIERNSCVCVCAAHAAHKIFHQPQSGTNGCIYGCFFFMFLLSGKQPMGMDQ